MCSIGEDDFGDEGGAHTMIEDSKGTEILDEICRKCNTEKSIIKLDHKESMCAACFLYYVRHKFRATLGSSKVVRRQSNVLINISGTAADVCLLHMIKFAFEEEAYKRLCFDLKVVFIDETCTEGDERRKQVSYRMERINEIKNVMSQFPSFTCYYSTVTNETKLIDDIQNVTNDFMSNIIEIEQPFASLFDSIKTLNSKQDFLERNRKNNLRNLAGHLECSYVFLTEIGIDLAKKLISSIALGRGLNVANDVAFCDDSIEGVKFVRPIKDLNQQEVENYIKFNKLKTIENLAFGANNGPYSSIQNLSSQFINGLQENYSSTVSTVYKCCSKITTKKESVTNRCRFCLAELDHKHSETLYAVEFSRNVSSIANDVQKLDDIENIRGKSVSNESLLCHGCRNIFTETSNNEMFDMFYSS